MRRPLKVAGGVPVHERKRPCLPMSFEKDRAISDRFFIQFSRHESLKLGMEQRSHPRDNDAANLRVVSGKRAMARSGDPASPAL